VSRTLFVSFSVVLVLASSCFSLASWAPSNTAEETGMYEVEDHDEEVDHSAADFADPVPDDLEFTKNRNGSSSSTNTRATSRP
jgi:hypothetical protein